MVRYTGDWHGLYQARWGEDIVPGAYAHPAKFRRGLIRKIYAHLLGRGYVQPGDRVVDPFGGVALGALDAIQSGLHWIGNELEGKFVDLGRQNIVRWERRYHWMWSDRWGSAVLLQGDSRDLTRVLRKAEGLVSSPPFGEGETRDRAPVQAGSIADCITRAYTQDRQGTTPGNLATMRATDEGLEAVQMGQQSGDDFWAAARAIVDQCYLILKPGAVAVWVVKRYARKKRLVDFPDQWRQMCEAAGFETAEWIRAWLVEEHGDQLGLFGNPKPIRTQRKGFFRQLYERKFPENRIDWEDVLIMRREGAGQA